MARSQARRDDVEGIDDDLPPLGMPGGGREGDGGVTVDLDELPDGKEKDKKDERRAKTGGEEREDETDVDGGLDRFQEEGDEALRERRRLERRERKEERQRRERELQTRLEATQRELAEVRARQERGEAADVRRTIGDLEREMRALEGKYAEAKAMKEQAFAKNDAKAVVEADEIMAQARDAYSEAGARREQIVAGVRQAQVEAQRPKISQTLKEQAESFMSEHEWYDHRGGDRDSAKVIAIDRKMADEGWDPNTAGYWEELRERVKEELPHRFGRRATRGEERDDPRDERGDDRPDDREQRRRPITSGGSREGGGGGSRTFYLSKDRVAALKEAGMWDDPAKRAKMIRTYKERDEREARERARQRR